MKQKEFEWLKMFTLDLLWELKETEYGAAEIFDIAIKNHPPPIDEEPKPEEKLRCPDCGTATIGIGGQGAYYFCTLCKKRWDFDWENHIVLNPHPNIIPVLPGMKEPNPEPKRNLTDPLPWGAYRIWNKEKTEGKPKMVVLDGAIFPNNHQGHVVDLTVQHSPKSTCFAIGTEVYCQDCKTAFSISSQFLERIVEPPK